MDYNSSGYTRGINKRYLAYCLASVPLVLAPVGSWFNVITHSGASYAIKRINSGGTCEVYRVDRTLPSTGEVNAIPSEFAYPLSFDVVDRDVKGQSGSARPQFLMVNIIGSLDAMPDEWKTNGIPGNWLRVGEEGESLIPDGTNKKFKLSRKCLECYQVLKSSNKGATWSGSTNAWKGGVEGASNGISFVAQPTEICMVFYRTSANPFELANSSGVSAMPSDVFGTNSANDYFGPLLVSNLLQKTPISSGVNATQRSVYRKITGFAGNSSTNKLEQHVEHEGIVLPVAQVPALKMLPFLSGHYLYTFYKELKHNGTQWGDDNKFNIVNKQSTVTDLNGEKVIVGQKRVELPYHFDGETY